MRCTVCGSVRVDSRVRLMPISSSAWQSNIVEAEKRRCFFFSFYADALADSSVFSWSVMQDMTWGYVERPAGDGHALSRRKWPPSTACNLLVYVRARFVSVFFQFSVFPCASAFCFARPCGRHGGGKDVRETGEPLPVYILMVVSLFLRENIHMACLCTPNMCAAMVNNTHALYMEVRFLAKCHSRAFCFCLFVFRLPASFRFFGYLYRLRRTSLPVTGILLCFMVCLPFGWGPESFS